MAYKAIRRSLGTAVAIAGAGAITWSAVAVLPANEQVTAAHRVVAAEVRPVALVSSLQLLTEAAAATLAQSADGLVTKLPALWNQVNVQWADADLTHWNYALVADSFLMPVAPLLFGPFNDAVAEVAANAFPSLADEILALPGLIEYGVVRLIGPLLSAIGGAGAAHAQIFYSMSNWELQPFFEALAAAPGHVISGFLYGGYGDLRPLLTGEVGGAPIAAPGLLTPWGQAPTPRDIKWAPDAPRPVVESESSVEELTDGPVVQEPTVAKPAVTTEPVEITDPVATVVTEPAAEDTDLPVKDADEAAKDEAAKDEAAEDEAAEEAEAAESEDAPTRKRFGDSYSHAKVRHGAPEGDASGSPTSSGDSSGASGSASDSE